MQSSKGPGFRLGRLESNEGAGVEKCDGLPWEIV